MTKTIATTSTTERTTNMTTTTRLEGAGARRWMVLLALAGLGSLGGACDRAHMTSYYGRSFNDWFAMQHVRSEPADSESTRRSLSSLDAQEAAAISKNYRRNVSGAAQSEGQGQMLMIGQASHGSEQYTPPPSVPQGQ
jgi:hypothetical protein